MDDDDEFEIPENLEGIDSGRPEFMQSLRETAQLAGYFHNCLIEQGFDQTVANNYTGIWLHTWFTGINARGDR